MSLIAKDPSLPAVVPYNTPAWVKARIGHLTASNMAKAMKYLKNGDESAERRKLKIQILAERLSDAAVDHFVTEDMQWGLDMEAAAKKAYTRITGRELVDGGFVSHRTIEFFGATPDAFVSFDGLLEVKCPRTETHTGYLIDCEVPSDYKPQMIVQLACTGRKWADFMSYDPRIVDPKLQAFIIRFEPTKDEIEKVEAEARKFLDEVEHMFRKMTER